MKKSRVFLEECMTKGKRQHLRTKRWCCKFYAENAFHGEINFQKLGKNNTQTEYTHTQTSKWEWWPEMWSNLLVPKPDQMKLLEFWCMCYSNAIVENFKFAIWEMERSKRAKAFNNKNSFHVELKNFCFTIRIHEHCRRIFIRHFYYKWKMQPAKKKSPIYTLLFWSFSTHLLQCLQSG